MHCQLGKTPLYSVENRRNLLETLELNLDLGVQHKPLVVTSGQKDQAPVNDTCSFLVVDTWPNLVPRPWK